MRQIAQKVAQRLDLSEESVLAQFKRTDSRYIKLVSLDDEVFEALSDPRISGVL